MLILTAKNYEDLIYYLEENKGVLYDVIIKCIEESFITNTEIFEIAQVIIEEEESLVTFSSPKKNWLQSLDSALEYYEEVQEYEKCPKIVELKERLINEKK